MEQVTERLTIKEIEARYGGLLVERELDPMTVYKRMERMWTVKGAIDIEQALRPPRRSGYTAFGETKSLQAWAEQFGMGESTLRDRIKHGWSLEKALTTPPGAVRAENGAIWELDGEAKTMRQWAASNGIRYITLRTAVKKHQDKGASDEDALRTALAELRTGSRTLLLDGERKSLEEWAQLAQLDPAVLSDRMDRGQKLRDILDETTPLTAFGTTAMLREWAEVLYMKPQEMLAVYREHTDADPETIVRQAALYRTGGTQLTEFLTRAVEHLDGTYVAE